MKHARALTRAEMGQTKAADHMTDNEITMDLSAVVAAMQPRLRDMIGANIALQLNLEREGLWVKADPGRIEQVIVILIANAADAMPEGGTLTVETSRINVGPDFIRQKVSESKDFNWLRLEMTSAASSMRSVHDHFGS